MPKPITLPPTGASYQIVLLPVDDVNIALPLQETLETPEIIGGFGGRLTFIEIEIQELKTFPNKFLA